MVTGFVLEIAVLQNHGLKQYCCGGLRVYPPMGFYGMETREICDPVLALLRTVVLCRALVMNRGSNLILDGFDIGFGNEVITT
jgi:hypothetical protein